MRFGTELMRQADVLGRFTQDAPRVTRTYLSPQHKQAGEYLIGLMQQAGMTAGFDALGNIVGRYEAASPQAPVVMTGSHQDSVRNAGKYDGLFGILTAIACVGDLHARGKRLPYTLEVVGFGDEEGVRFGSTLLGSRAVAGTFDPAVLAKTDADGMTMRDALTAFGLDPARFATVARRPEQVLAYAELHIEQGPVLEASGLPVGVVTAINGGNRFTMELTGMAGHAGTVPMGLRRDALAAAAECVLAVERIAGSMPDVVGTVGRIDARPGAMNVIPGKVQFSLDVRAPTDDKRHAAVAAMHAECASIAQRRTVGLAITPVWEASTAPCAPALQQQIAAAIEREGIRVHHLPSGAGHDGQAILDIAPIGMLFVRCEGGISHNPAEAVTLSDVATGTRVLARFILAFTPPARHQ